VFLLVGSGSCGIDACLGSAFSSGEKIVIGINGFFGERIRTIAESYGLEIIVVEGAWDEPLSLDEIHNALASNRDMRGVAVVHLETTTAIVNPIKEIGVVAREHDVAFFVDAVSSLGGLQFKMDEWKIELVRLSLTKVPRRAARAFSGCCG
jgi:alanine-glyoxylate transaminase/serine-glyoxylate transaminase/serine-pyruvate transaminase